MREWALKRQEKSIEKAKETHPNAKIHEKKLYWQTTFGKIEIDETVMKVATERIMSAFEPRITVAYSPTRSTQTQDTAARNLDNH